MEKNNRFLRIVKTLDNISCFIAKISFGISCLLLVALAVAIFAYVINRAFIGQVWLFVEEWSGFALIPITYLGLGNMVRKNKGLYVDLITDKLSPKAQDFLEVIFAVFSFFLIISMLSMSIEWLGYTLEVGVKSRGPMRTPLWIFSIIIVSGLFVYAVDMFFYFFYRLFSFIGKDIGLKFSKEQIFGDDDCG